MRNYERQVNITIMLGEISSCGDISGVEIRATDRLTQHKNLGTTLSAT